MSKTQRKPVHYRYLNSTAINAHRLTQLITLNLWRGVAPKRKGLGKQNFE